MLRLLGDSISIDDIDEKTKRELDLIFGELYRERSVWEIGYSQFQSVCWKILNSSQVP